nr:hypothetical protein [Tanacetum cinerariifolium]
VRGYDEEVLTKDEIFDHEKESLHEDAKITKIFRVETDIFHYETPICKVFKEFNYLLEIDVDVLTKDIPGFKTYEDIRIHGSTNGIKMYLGLKKSHDWIMALGKSLLMILIMFANRTNNDDTIQANQECLDEREPKDNDDDINDLDDYLIQNDAPFIVNEEEEQFNERRCKLLGIAYVKPPTCKFKKFEVIKYSFRPADEYVAIKEYEYDIGFEQKKTCLKSTIRFFARRTKDGS